MKNSSLWFKNCFFMWHCHIKKLSYAETKLYPITIDTLSIYLPKNWIDFILIDRFTY